MHIYKPKDEGENVVEGYFNSPGRILPIADPVSESVDYVRKIFGVSSLEAFYNKEQTQNQSPSSQVIQCPPQEVERQEKTSFAKLLMGIFLMKIAISSNDNGSNNLQMRKRIGIFVVSHHSALPEFPGDFKISQWIQQNGGGVVEPGNVFEIHVLPKNEVSLKEILDSVKRLYEYVKATRSAPEAPLYIYGMSHMIKPIAGFIRRYGFQTFDLPPNIKKWTGAGWALNIATKFSSLDIVQRKFGGFTIDDVRMCYVPVNVFLEHYERVNGISNVEN